ncbi:hypothetical protein [Streptomyces sp. KL116D]|uniref:hypothetical protein n=1 Tax=Streptomyces sp. KL116D TaxID=3045152 RepID=UPI0035592C11
MKAVRSIDAGIQVGWTIANQVYQAAGRRGRHRRLQRAARGRLHRGGPRRRLIGVQSYTRTKIGADGPIPAPADAERTLTQWSTTPPPSGTPCGTPPSWSAPTCP